MTNAIRPSLLDNKDWKQVVQHLGYKPNDVVRGVFAGKMNTTPYPMLPYVINAFGYWKEILILQVRNSRKNFTRY